jgi:ketosteroid isomerase-like protein
MIGAFSDSFWKGIFMASTMDVGKKLVEMCGQGKFREAMEALYAPNIVSVEPFAPPGKNARMEGIAAIREKTDWWEKNHEMHSVKVEGPWPNGDQFIVRFILDVTAKSGPMAGKRFKMDETGLYTVKDGKVVQEEFFYHMGG